MTAVPRRRISDAHSLRALAHPARVALIELLAVHGSLTATEASELLGESPSNCSFHLRQLAKFGLIEPAPSTGGRQRPWQVVTGGIGIDVESLDDAEFNATANVVNELWVDRQAAAELDWSRRSISEPPAWRQAAFSDFTVRWLTVDELQQLQASLTALLEDYQERRDPAKRPAGTRPVRLHLSAFPAPGRPQREGS